MSDTTFFYNKDHRLTSIRTSTKLVSITMPLDGRSGGITFHNGQHTARFTSSGFTSSSIKLGKYTTYFGTHGEFTDRLTPFTRRMDS